MQALTLAGLQNGGYTLQGLTGPSLSCSEISVGTQLRQDAALFLPFAGIGALGYKSSEAPRQVTGQARKGKTHPADDWELEEEDVPDNNDITFASQEDMQTWLQNKPKGFGSAKTYDTTLETKLLEEIGALKKKQEAEGKTKFRKVKGDKALLPVKKGEPEKIPDGVLVWVGNLPKKRNVERDLRAGIKGIRGLLHIRPCVTGDKNTREPTCKGFGFLTFETLADAQKFVQLYHQKPIKFGKLERALLCQLAKQAKPGQENAETSVVSTDGIQTEGRLALNEEDGEPLELGIGGLPQASSEEREIELLRRRLRELEAKAAKEKVGNSLTETGKGLRALPGLKSSLAEGRVELKQQMEDEDEEVDDKELEKLEDEIWDQLEDDDDAELEEELELEQAGTAGRTQVRAGSSSGMERSGQRTGGSDMRKGTTTVISGFEETTDSWVEEDEDEDEDDEEGEWDEEELDIEVEVVNVDSAEEETRDWVEAAIAKDMSAAAEEERMEESRRALIAPEEADGSLSQNPDGKSVGGVADVPLGKKKTPRRNVALRGSMADSIELAPDGSNLEEVELKILALEKKLFSRGIPGGAVKQTAKKNPRAQGLPPGPKGAAPGRKKSSPNGSQNAKGLSERKLRGEERKLYEGVLSKYSRAK